MRCFHHPDTPAIGTCKVCSRGLCSDCTTDLGHGLACKGVHEKEAQQINNIIQTNAKAYEKAGLRFWALSSFFLLMGIIFIGGYFFYKDFLPSLFMGITFVLYGLFHLMSTKGLRKKTASSFVNKNK